MLSVFGVLNSVIYYFWVQLVPQQKGTVTRPRMTLAQSPVMTLQGPTHSRILVGQLQTGVSSTLDHSLMCIRRVGTGNVYGDVLPPSEHSLMRRLYIINTR